MPFTFNGFGTILYGARDFQPDGSHTTTEWLAFAYVPVFPLRSQRVKPTGEKTNAIFFYSSNYEILTRTKPNRRQVLFVYGWFAVVVTSFWLAAALDAWWLALPGIAMLFVPRFMRREAVKAMQEKYASKAAIAEWLNLERARLEMQVRALGLLQCPACKAMNKTQAKVCAGCGTTLPSQT